MILKWVIEFTTDSKKQLEVCMTLIANTHWRRGLYCPSHCTYTTSLSYDICSCSFAAVIIWKFKYADVPDHSNALQILF